MSDLKLHMTGSTNSKTPRSVDVICLKMTKNDNETSPPPPLGCPNLQDFERLERIKDSRRECHQVVVIQVPSLTDAPHDENGFQGNAMLHGILHISIRGETAIGDWCFIANRTQGALGVKNSTAADRRLEVLRKSDVSVRRLEG